MSGKKINAFIEIKFFFDQFDLYADRDALVWRDGSYSYGWLLERVLQWSDWLAARDIGTGKVVLMEADFGPDAVALFLALVQRGCILVPLCAPTDAQRERCARIAEAEALLQQDDAGQFSCTKTERQAGHPHFCELRNRRHPGLVLFSSGSTGGSQGGGSRYGAAAGTPAGRGQGVSRDSVSAVRPHRRH